jgi:hypothetical protein
MTARILRFPPRQPFDVLIKREGQAWLVIARSHAWLHGSRNSALNDAREVARGFGTSIREVT